MTDESIQLKRNINGQKYERNGDIDLAIRLYEQNVAENFDGSFPYNRLAVIYRKRKQYEEEKRVLLHAIYVFDEIVSPLRADREPKLCKFRERLEKLERIIAKV